jgi:hypothetical protein
MMASLDWLGVNVNIFLDESTSSLVPFPVLSVHLCPMSYVRRPLLTCVPLPSFSVKLIVPGSSRRPQPTAV